MEITEALKVALEYLGHEWKPKRECFGFIELDGGGIVQCGLPGHDRYETTGTMFRAWRDSHAWHEVPCPLLTDELAFWCLRKLGSRGHRVVLGTLGLSETLWTVAIASDTTSASDPAEAIIQAVAALAREGR